MNKVDFNAYSYLLFISLICLTACQGQEDTRENMKVTQIPFANIEAPKEIQIAQYIRNIFQDKNGHLWFGTNGKGVAYFNGDSIAYFSLPEGFNGQQITGMTADSEHNIWFATNLGVVKLEWSNSDEHTKRFTNYSNQEYFGGQQFWSVLADSKNNIWAGTSEGIYFFDGKNWTPFRLTLPEEVSGNFITKGTTWSVAEDKLGNIWFSTNGFGAFKYDGQSFTQYTKKDGLTDDRVDNIMQDSKGNMWFGTRFGGVSKFDGDTFTNYNVRNGSIQNDEVCVIYEDKKGDIWFSSEGYGVYRFRASSKEPLTNYSENEGLGVRAVQTIFEDKEGRLWAGGGGGLYRLEGNAFINVTKEGPWE